MGPRVEKHKEEKITFVIKVIIIFLSVTLPIVSIVIWNIHYMNFKPTYFVRTIQECYLISIGIFLLITAFNRIVATIFKTLFKLMFNVGIISFVMISTLSPMEQNLNIIFVTIFMGYLEAYLEICNLIEKKLSSLTILNFKYIDSKTFYSLAKPVAVIIIAIIHGIIPFAIASFIKDISFR